MKFRWSYAVLIVALIVAVPPSSFGGQMAFDGEIDCDGIVAAGGSMPFTVRFENQSLNSIPLDVEVTVNAPGIGSRTIASGSFTLGPNQDRDFSRSLNLPATAPSGSYSMGVVTMSATETVSDTCSFNVQ